VLAVLSWYLALQLAAAAVWPLVARACLPLPDRGWTASKTIGILAVSWLAWLVCMVTPIPFTRLTLVVALLAIAAASWLAARRCHDHQALLAWPRACWRPLLAWEAVFLAVFVGFALLRAHAPAIQGTEKPMDMAFLNGFVAAQRLPSQDTWLSGYGVPYYYFGYFIFACLTKLSGVSAAVGYNLAAASIPALATLGLAGLAWNLARMAALRPAWAALGAALTSLFALAIGNLSTFFELLVARGWLTANASATLGVKNFAAGIQPGVWPPTGTWWFAASRVVPNTQPDGINEFPFFTAYLADLHPHFIALPFEALALSCAAIHVLTRGATLRSPWTQGLAALSLGSLLILNTWDIAPFWLLYLGLSYAGACCSERRKRILTVLAAPVIGTLLVAPYFIGYHGPPLGLGVVNPGDRTPLASELVLFGPQLLLLAVLGLSVRWRSADRRGWFVTGVGVLLGFLLVLLHEPTLALLTVLTLLLVPWPNALERVAPAAWMLLVVGWFAVLMLLGVEVIYLDDVFHSRMNTVFKFDENAWLLIGLATGAGAAVVAGTATAWRHALAWRVALGACVVVALVGGLVYPITAVMSRLGERPPYGLTLDGAAFLSPDDAGAIAWLASQNRARRVVDAEAVAGEYSDGARIATYSGAATVLGWPGHELQWRGPLPELSTRQSAIDQLYRAPNADALRSIMRQYGIQYVVVGDLERQQYGDAVDAVISSALPLAYRSGRTTIYGPL
jgi:YYY domain-containing protein